MHRIDFDFMLFIQFCRLSRFHDDDANGKETDSRKWRRETSSLSSKGNAARIGHRGQFQYLQKLWRQKFHTIHR